MDQKLAKFLRGDKVKEAVNILLLLSDVKKTNIPKFIQKHNVTLRLAWETLESMMGKGESPVRHITIYLKNSPVSALVSIIRMVHGCTIVTHYFATDTLIKSKALSASIDAAVKEAIKKRKGKSKISSPPVSLRPIPGSKLPALPQGPHPHKSTIELKSPLKKLQDSQSSEQSISQTGLAEPRLKHKGLEELSPLFFDVPEPLQEDLPRPELRDASKITLDEPLTSASTTEDLTWSFEEPASVKPVTRKKIAEVRSKALKQSLFSTATPSVKGPLFPLNAIHTDEHLMPLPEDEFTKKILDARSLQDDIKLGQVTSSSQKKIQSEDTSYFSPVRKARIRLPSHPFTSTKIAAQSSPQQKTSATSDDFKYEALSPILPPLETEPQQEGTEDRVEESESSALDSDDNALDIEEHIRMNREKKLRKSIRAGKFPAHSKDADWARPTRGPTHYSSLRIKRRIISKNYKVCLPEFPDLAPIFDFHKEDQYDFVVDRKWFRDDGKFNLYAVHSPPPGEEDGAQNYPQFEDLDMASTGFTAINDWVRQDDGEDIPAESQVEVEEVSYFRDGRPWSWLDDADRFADYVEKAYPKPKTVLPLPEFPAKFRSRRPPFVSLTVRQKYPDWKTQLHQSEQEMAEQLARADETVRAAGDELATVPVETTAAPDDQVPKAPQEETIGVTVTSSLQLLDPVIRGTIEGQAGLSSALALTTPEVTGQSSGFGALQSILSNVTLHNSQGTYSLQILGEFRGIRTHLSLAEVPPLTSDRPSTEQTKTGSLISNVVQRFLHSKSTATLPVPETLQDVDPSGKKPKDDNVPALVPKETSIPTVAPLEIVPGGESVITLEAPPAAPVEPEIPQQTPVESEIPQQAPVLEDIAQPADQVITEQPRSIQDRPRRHSTLNISYENLTAPTRRRRRRVVWRVHYVPRPHPRPAVEIQELEPPLANIPEEIVEEVPVILNIEDQPILPKKKSLANENFALEILKEKITDLNQLLRFSDCCEPGKCSRKDAAKFFFQLLNLSKEGIVEIIQEEQGGDPYHIIIKGLDKSIFEKD